MCHVLRDRDAWNRLPGRRPQLVVQAQQKGVSMTLWRRSTVHVADRVDARHQAEIKTWWRDWHRYLQAQLQVLDARQAATLQGPSFERTDEAWEYQRVEAEQTLRRIPH